MPDLTILITSSPVPSHPSIRLMKSVLTSLRHIKDLEPSTEILIAQDGCEDDAVRPSYEKYLENLERCVDSQHRPIKIIKNDKKGHLTGNIRNAISHVRTRYMLVLQHDLPFVADFEISPVIEDMEQNPNLKHVRFNRRRNIKAKWDAQSDVFGEQLQCKNCCYTKTGAWSDQNHLAAIDYYTDIVLEEVPDGTFMENVLNERCHANQARYGTYIYGELGFPAMIQHANGRASSRFAIQDRVQRIYGRVARKAKAIARLES